MLLELDSIKKEAEMWMTEAKHLRNDLKVVNSQRAILQDTVDHVEKKLRIKVSVAIVRFWQ